MPSLPRFDSFQHWSHQAMINAALAAGIALIVVIWIYTRVFQGGEPMPFVLAPDEPAVSPIAANLQSTYNPTVDTPTVDADAFIDNSASIVGNVTIERSAYIGRTVTIDSSAGQPVYVGSGTNLQAGSTVTARPTFVRSSIDQTAYTGAVEGKWAVYLGREVSIGTGARLIGPLAILDGAYVGPNVTIVEATIGAGSVVEAGALVIGVSVPDGRYVPAGSIVTDQATADALPEIATGYAMNVAGAETVALHLALLQAMGFSGTLADATPGAADDDEAMSESAPAGEHDSGLD
jgi:carbonic anhydrase/acetyltransferase-like protein (isoleucine patch superfamily)